jgi:hypothetical protein
MNGKQKDTVVKSQIELSWRTTLLVVAGIAFWLVFLWGK